MTRSRMGSTTMRQRHELLQLEAMTANLLCMFCTFLESRVQTKHLKLLKDLIQECVVPHNETLEHFLDLGAHLIAILPLDHPLAHVRTRAASCLLEQAAKSIDMPEMMAVHRQCGHEFFKYLGAQAVTKNLLKLACFFDAFCLGKEDDLQRFVARGCDVVSILPERLVPRHDRAGFYGPKLSHHAGRDRRNHTRKTNARAPSKPAPVPLVTPTHGSNSEQWSRSPHCISPKLPLVRTPYEGLQREVYERVRSLEVCAPWKHVFRPDRLTYPVDEAEYPEVVDNLRRFWRIHARAVWERHFWCPLASSSKNSESLNRMSRQRAARQCFEKTVLQVVADTMGIQFFCDLDQRPLHEGWWYRPQRVNLLAICEELGPHVCWDYLQSQMNARFPVLPASASASASASGTHSRFLYRDSWSFHVSKSMWSMAQPMKRCIEQIETLKTNMDTSTSVYFPTS